MAGNYPVPEGLAWDLFLGAAPHVDYHPVYHPFNWRGWVDWGCGAIGDMGAHLIDHLDVGARSRLPDDDRNASRRRSTASCFPNATMTVYEFPARGGKPPVKLTLVRRRAAAAEAGRARRGQELNADGGALLVGSKGKLLHDTYGKNPRLLPESLHAVVRQAGAEAAAHPDENHEMNWVDAAKGKTAASCPFEYAAKLTEVMLLGVVALKAGRKIEYDGANMRDHERAVGESVSGARIRAPGWSL